MSILKKSTFLLFCFALLLLAACGTIPTTPTASTQSTHNGTTITNATKTVTTPSTNTTTTANIDTFSFKTDCPAAGTVRPAILPTMSKGNHPAIIYTMNGNGPTQSNPGKISVFDTVTKTNSDLVQRLHIFIRDAQVSTDGQWILFTANDFSAKQTALQLIRVDGKGLQTLYCQSTNVLMQNVEWSLNQQLVAFYGQATPNAPFSVFLLDIQHGAFHVLLQEQGNLIQPATWLDDTHLYLHGAPNASSPQSDLYSLDLNKGTSQQYQDLQLVSRVNPGCWSFDTSLDSTKIYLNEYNCYNGQANEPGVTSFLVGGGIAYSIYHGSLVVNTVRAIPNRVLLLVTGATPNGTQQLWRIGTDGNGLTNLISLQGKYGVMLNQETQYYWANASRDGSMFVATISDDTAGAPSYSIKYYSINGTLLGTIANSGPSQTSPPVTMAGWTTI